ncbi:hypothetical protein E4U21_007783 [Claviceps maximensis]|nr:hypothetical protein E4U21_007783 [Claviceps maximensis]
MTTDFKLSAQLLGHESDVRAVTFASSDVVLTASRDCTVRKWSRCSQTPSSFEEILVSRGSEYVNSIAFAPPSADFPSGLVVSGGKDTIIEVKSLNAASTDSAERLLIGHAHNVCTLDIAPDGSYLISGGWDGQARVWNLQKWETTLMLAGHEDKAVWALVALDAKTVVTGCADKNIRIFDLTQSTAGEVQPQSTIYTPDVVRGLCKVPKNHPSGADIASASNDGRIRLWKLNGQQVGELHGHDSFVYSLTSLPSGELVSAGEDRTVRVWKGTECVQTITHPAISVWTVAADAITGDIVTGASDGIARIFTRRSSQVADKDTLAAFDTSVKASAIPQQQLGGINKEKLPGPDFLTAKSGTKEGQVQMIKEENGNVTAHTWSMSQQQWINVGTVVDAAGSNGQRAEYKGKSYDFVFDVDIEDGKPPLKLPYNLSENPYERATKFLNDNELPLSYLDNVADFINKNTKGATLGQADSSGPDPYGTESRYRPEGSEFSQSKVLPQKEYLNIAAAKYEAMFSKLSNVNKTLIASGRKDVALNPGEESVLQSLRTALEKNQPIPVQSLDLVVRMITAWPYGDRLAALDLLRCIVRFSSVAQFSDAQHGSVLDLAIKFSIPSESPPNENAVMMGIRAMANICATVDGRSLITTQASKVIQYLERVLGVKGGNAIGKLNRNVLIAVTTSALNLSVLIDKEKLLAPDERRRLVIVLGAALDEQTDSEVLYRGLVALGTLLTSSKEVATGLAVGAWVRGAKSRATEDRVKAVADECLALV